MTPKPRKSPVVEDKPEIEHEEDADNIEITDEQMALYLAIRAEQEANPPVFVDRSKPFVYDEDDET
jgi:hypothetical protein